MNHSDRGVALVLVSALLALLAFLAVALTHETRLSAVGSASSASARRARLAAESALDYAAARLWTDTESLADKGILPTTANACDDWTDRSGQQSGINGQPSLNPSYARGDRWGDRDGDGVYTAGIDAPFPDGDLDADGRFQAWSGRLRGRGETSPRFSLRIAPLSAGRICVNSGELGSPTDDHDADGVLNADDTVDSTPYLLDSDGNGIDDYRDPDFPGNAHLVNTLDNLGAVLGLSTLRTEPFVPSPKTNTVPFAPLLGTIETSDLGRAVVASRPRGGYAAIEELRPVLGASDYAKAAPFLTVHGVPILLSTGPWGGQTEYVFAVPETRFESRVPVDLRKAPLEVLRALLRHAAVSGNGSLLPSPNLIDQTFVRLSADEADAAAQALAAACAAGKIRDWRDLLAELVAVSNAVFRPDPFVVQYNLMQGTSADPVQGLLKQDLVLAALDAQWQFPDIYARARNTLEVPREAPPIGVDAAAVRTVHQQAFAGLLETRPFTFPVVVQSPTGPFTTYVGIGNIPNRSTMGGTLRGSPEAFRVESDGWSNSLAGRATRSALAGDLLLTTGAITASSQQDFTPLFASGLPNDPNPAVWRLTGGVFYDGSQPAARQGMQGFPRFPLVGPDGVRTNFAINPPSIPAASYRNPRGHGWLQLSARQIPTSDDGTALWLHNPDITYAVPHNEDGAPGPQNVFDSAHWADNVFDPAVRPLHAPVAKQVPPAPTFQRLGVRFSPFGPRETVAADTLSETWVPAPFRVSPVSVVPNLYLHTYHTYTWIEEGTVVLWYAAGRELGVVRGTLPFLDLDYQNQLGTGMSPFFTLEVVPELDEVRFRVNDPAQPSAMQTFTLPYPAAQPPASLLAGTGWRCVALRIKRDMSWQFNLSTPQPPVHAEIFIDGVPVTPSPLPLSLVILAPQFQNFQTGPWPSFPNASGRVQFSAVHKNLDDLCFFERALSDSEIHDLALVPRLARTGAYGSQRFRFDPASFPRGARIRRLAWDAFLPAPAGASIDFTASAYDTAGNPLGSRTQTYDGTGDPWLRIDGLPPTASIDYGIAIKTNPPLVVPDSAGLPVPILRDSPIIEEVRIEYGPPRPAWRGLADR